MIRTARPFLRWAGGKGWLAQRARYFIPNSFGSYFEPFLGSGAVFFSMLPTRAFLSDSNAELINAFRVVQLQIDRLILALTRFSAGETEYFSVRSEDPSDPVGRAARFVYLNRTCWNGLYRVNSAGQFNVPYGWGDRPLTFDTGNLRACSQILRNALIKKSGFEAALRKVGENDFVFLDPPYAKFRHLRGFVSYNNRLFDWDAQEALAQSLRELTKSGGMFLLTEPDIPSIRRLYDHSEYHCVRASHFTKIAADPSRRVRSKELLIANYDIPDIARN